MAKYISGRHTNLNVGISNHSEGKTSVTIIGNVGVGTNIPTDQVGSGNTAILAVGILTANRVYSTVYGEFTGSSVVADNIVGTSLSVSGISSLGNVKVSGGIITATTGVVTYYGDGSNLTGVGATAKIVTDSLNVLGISTLGGTLSVAGVTTFTSTLDSAGSTQGSVVMHGGLGVSKQVNFGDGLNVIGHTELDNINVSGIATLGGTLSVAGVSTFTGVSTFVGIATFQSVDINNGTIDGTNIGVSHRSNANFNYVDIANDLDVTGNTELKGNVDLGNSGTDTITPNGRFDADIRPHIDNNQNYKLGSSGYRWHTAHFGTGSINIDSGIDATGVVTATSFIGDGSTLTGVASTTVLEDAGINTAGTSTFTNILATGIATAANFDSTSDIRLKTNIEVIQDPLAKVIKIEGVSFNWKQDNRPALGVIADQVQQILPQLVHGDDPKTVNYNGLIGLLIEAVKEQQTQIDELKSKLS